MTRVPLTATTASLSTSLSLPVQAQEGKPASAPPDDPQPIVVVPAGSQPSRQGAGEHFTGSVRIDPLFQANEPARGAGASVTFEPGARTAWHTHPLGQTLIVTAGTGCAQRWGDAVQEIRPGDVVWIPPGQKHWHGASPTTGMTHIAIQEQLDGKVVAWLEQVSDAQYSGPREAAAGDRTRQESL